MTTNSFRESTEYSTDYHLHPVSQPYLASLPHLLPPASTSSSACLLINLQEEFDQRTNQESNYNMEESDTTKK